MTGRLCTFLWAAPPPRFPIQQKPLRSRLIIIIMYNYYNYTYQGKIIIVGSQRVIFLINDLNFTCNPITLYRTANTLNKLGVKLCILAHNYY